MQVLLSASGRCGSRSTSALGAAIFTVYAVWPVSVPLVAGALAFATGVGAYGWVGIFFVISADVGGSRGTSRVRAAPRELGFLRVPWATFGALSALVTVTMLLAGSAIDRERGRP